MTVVPFKTPVANATGTSEEHPEPAPYARSARERAGTRARDAEQAAYAIAVYETSEVDVAADFLNRALTFWTPPEIWSEPRPSLSQVAAYAWRGPWTGEDTPSRTFGRVYAALVSIPLHALAYVVLWLVERPARLAVTGVLTLLVSLSFIV